MRSSRLPVVLLVLVSIFGLWSVIRPEDTYLTWVLESFPALLGGVLLVLTYRRFRLTSFLYVLIAIHACVLMLGGHYSYAKVPLGFWMEHWFNLTRNDYDKIGHFFQGFEPAILTREIVLRRSSLGRGKWLGFFAIAVPMWFSACYEIFEWMMACLLGARDADAFLGAQGYVWDTQTDMFACLVGACAAVFLFSRLHDRCLRRELGV